MSDNNLDYMEVSARRKKKNQLISAAIILAIIVLGVLVWGWMELQKTRSAERIKNALNSQSEMAISESPAPESTTAFTPDSLANKTPEAQPETLAVVTAPVKVDSEKVNVEAPVEKPLKVVKEKPKVNKIHPKIDESYSEPKVVTPKEPMVKKVKPEANIVERKPEPMPVPKVQPKIEPKVEPITPVATPAPKEVIPEPKKIVTKAFVPEDLPMPAHVEPSEESKKAVAELPKISNSDSASADASPNYKNGVEAYKQQDYANAVRSFAAMPKPNSKKRGIKERDEYVKGNFLRGLALQKTGHLSEAVTAYTNVLDFEKYYPIANMNLGICYVELKQFAKAHQSFEAVTRDQSFIEPAVFDDVMQRTKYFWALAWTRLYKNASDPDKQSFYRTQAVIKWKDYQVWFSKNEKFKSDNTKAENYLKSLSPL